MMILNLNAEIVYHSSNFFSQLNSSWTSKPPLAIKYRFDAGSLEGPGGPRSLCSTLDRLLAWEDKLSKEVKVSKDLEWSIVLAYEQQES